MFSETAFLLLTYPPTTFSQHIFLSNFYTRKFKIVNTGKFVRVLLHSEIIKPHHFCCAQEPFVNPYKWASLFGVSKTSSGVYCVVLTA